MDCGLLSLLLFESTGQQCTGIDPMAWEPTLRGRMWKTTPPSQSCLDGKHVQGHTSMSIYIYEYHQCLNIIVLAPTRHFRAKGQVETKHN